jgi:hypothetical protein
MASCRLTAGRLSVTELEMTPRVETEDFSDDLSDEALDRVDAGALSYCSSK